MRGVPRGHNLHFIMMPDRTRTPHLFSAFIVLGATAAILFEGRMRAIQLEQRALAWTASKRFHLKDQGLVFQRTAARARRILPLYGSSELAMPVPDRASKFFNKAPTGFEISPVGRAGTTSLVILQKIAALGADLRGRRVAISLSPVWFLTPVTKADWYDGNFSPLIASELTFGSALDLELKRDIASRMLQFPATRDRYPFLKFALERLAADSWFDRLIFYAIFPFGKIYTAGLELQDHFAAVAHILYQTKAAHAPHRQRLAASAAEPTSRSSDIWTGVKLENASMTVASMTRGRSDSVFLRRMNAAPEWADLELLLRALAEVHARPLLLSMPMDGQFYDQLGYSRLAREKYYQKMRDLAGRYQFELIEFEDHDEDSSFLDSQHTHLTQEGWLFYDRALDDFFHGRVPRS
jgi:D-alanine transfer protein